MTPVVFLSHSSDDSDRAAALVAALEAGGALKTTFDVRDLRAGDRWMPRLFKWLAHCRAGVVLLTANVMQRAPWVLQEATILRARALLEGPAFALYVLIDEEVLAHPTWTQWFAPLQLRELQCMVLPQDGHPTAAAVAAVRAGVAAVAQQGHDYFSLLAGRLRDKLKPMAQVDTVRDLLADKLDVADADWVRIVGPDAALETVFAQRLCQGDFGRFETIDAMFNELQGLCERPLRQALLGALRAYWVPLLNASRLGEAIGRLAPCAADAVPPNVVLLQTEAPAPMAVADMLRERQFWVYQRLGLLVHVAGGNETAATLQQRVRDEIARVRFAAQPAIAPAPMVEELERKLRRQQYTFVHVAAPQTLAHVLPAARLFWPCLFVVTAPAALCREFAERLGREPLALPQPGDEFAHLNAIAEAEAYNLN